jgi:hypothetical protein
VRDDARAVRRDGARLSPRPRRPERDEQGPIDLSAVRSRRRRAALRQRLEPFAGVAVPVAVLLAFLVYAFTR